MVGNYSKNEKFNYDEVFTMTDEEIKELIVKFINKQVSIIEQVENKFLENKDILEKIMKTN